MAGDSNILYWLKARGIEPAEDLVAEIRKLAKSVGRVLEEEEVLAVVRRWRGEG